MEIKYLVIQDNGVNDYIFIAGEIENNKLNGWGLEEVATTEGIRKTYGRFVDGKLDGVGVKKIVNNGGDEILEEYGFYKNGKHIDDEEFMSMAEEQRIMETLRKLNLEFVNASKFYLNKKEEKIDGPCLIYSHETHRYGNTDNDYKNHVLKEYRYVSNGIIEGFSFNITLHPTYQTRYFFTVFEKNEQFFEMLYSDWGYMATQKDEIFVDEGKEEIERNTYKGGKSLIIHIPNSVHKIADRAISPKRTHYLEVFYNGTKDEWDRIEKGYREDWCEEDTHRIGMGVSRTVFIDWAVNNFKITIHCLDGDIITKDHSHSY